MLLHMYIRCGNITYDVFWSKVLNLNSSRLSIILLCRKYGGLRNRLNDTTTKEINPEAEMF